MYVRHSAHINHWHDDVIKWKHFPRDWPFVREIHRSPVNFPHKGQWRGALMFSLIYAWINDWVNNREAGDLKRQHGHYDVIVMELSTIIYLTWLEQLAISLGLSSFILFYAIGFTVRLNANLAMLTHYSSEFSLFTIKIKFNIISNRKKCCWWHHELRSPGINRSCINIDVFPWNITVSTTHVLTFSLY